MTCQAPIVARPPSVLGRANRGQTEVQLSRGWLPIGPVHQQPAESLKSPVSMPGMTEHQHGDREDTLGPGGSVAGPAPRDLQIGTSPLPLSGHPEQEQEGERQTEGQ